MSRAVRVEDTVVIAVDPETVDAQVADPSQMGRWSPENRGIVGTASGRPLAVGDSFVGRNKRGRVRWVTRCTVTAADPGRRFEFRVGQIGVRTPRVKAPIATWEYVFEPVDAGTRVTERWTDDRKGWPDRVAAAFDKVVTGGSLFADFQRRNIARTLANLKSDLEKARAGLSRPEPGRQATARTPSRRITRAEAHTVTPTASTVMAIIALLLISTKSATESDASSQ